MYTATVCIEIATEQDTVDVAFEVDVRCACPPVDPIHNHGDGGEPGYGPEFEIDEIRLLRTGGDTEMDFDTLEKYYTEDIVKSIEKLAIDDATENMEF